MITDPKKKHVASKNMTRKVQILCEKQNMKVTCISDVNEFINMQICGDNCHGKNVYLGQKKTTTKLQILRGTRYEMTRCI